MIAENNYEILSIEEQKQLFRDYVERLRKLSVGEKLKDTEKDFDMWKRKWLREHGKAEWTLDD